MTTFDSGKTLIIEDFNEVIALLERHHYNKASYHQLGLRLKLSYNTLEKIKKNHGEVDPCFTECLACWLRKADSVENPTIDTLIAALRGIGENAVADNINEEMQTVSMPGSESLDRQLSDADRPVATTPTLHISQGHPTQPVASLNNPGVKDIEFKIDQRPELQEIANNLQGKYDFLVIAVQKSLEDHHIDVKKAKRLIERCLMTKADVVSELMPCIDIFEKSNDFESFFGFLSKYKFIGYLNYKLLKKLAELVQDDEEIKKLFFEYEKEYAKLLSSASFQDFIPLFERISDLSPTAPLGLPYISFRLKEPWLITQVYTWVSTFGEFSWSYYALLKQLRKNCIIITYAILPCVLDDVMRDLKDPVILKRLEDKDVTVIEIIESPQKEEATRAVEHNTLSIMSNKEEARRGDEVKKKDIIERAELVQQCISESPAIKKLIQYVEGIGQEMFVLSMDQQMKDTDIKERDRLIKELEEKLQTKEAEIQKVKTTHEEHMKTEMKVKNIEIAKLMKRITSLQGDLETLKTKEAELIEAKTEYMSEDTKEKERLIKATKEIEEEQKKYRQLIDEANKEIQLGMEEKLQMANVTNIQGTKVKLVLEQESQVHVLKKMHEQLESIDQKMEDVHEELEHRDKKMEDVQRQIMYMMDKKMEGMRQEVEAMTNQKIKSMEQNMKDMHQKVEGIMNQKMEDMRQQMEDIMNQKMNDIDKNIEKVKEKISKDKESSAPITTEAVLESNYTGTSLLCS